MKTIDSAIQCPMIRSERKHARTHCMPEIQFNFVRHFLASLFLWRPFVLRTIKMKLKCTRFYRGHSSLALRLLSDFDVWKFSEELDKMVAHLTGPQQHWSINKLKQLYEATCKHRPIDDAEAAMVFAILHRNSKGGGSVLRGILPILEWCRRITIKVMSNA